MVSSPTVRRGDGGGDAKEMLDEYRRLIPDVPYIGGWRNSNSSLSR